MRTPERSFSAKNVGINPRFILFPVLLWVCFYSRPALGAYCYAEGACSEYITSVVVADIAKTDTGCGGYVNYTWISTAMEKGKSYPITVINGEPYVDDWCGVWIDWNQDQDFTDAGETIVMDGDYQTFTGTITPPANAVLGNTRMRVRIVWTGGDTLEPCGYSDYGGEVEDYTIIVTLPPAGRIQGVKFHDLNGNGIRDAAEPGLQGWKIYLDLNNNGQFDSNEPNADTNSAGSYQFPNLPPSNYIVAEVNKSGWTQTYPGYAGGRLFAVDINSTTNVEMIFEINPDNGALINSFPAPSDLLAIGLQGLAVGPASLFFTDLSFGPQGQVMTDIWELEPDTGLVIDHDQIDYSGGYLSGGAAYLNGKIYITKGKTKQAPLEILVWDPVLDTVVNTITVNDANLGDGLTGDPDANVLFATKFPYKIVKIDPSNGAILATLEPSGVYPLSAGLAYLNGKILMGCRGYSNKPPKVFCIDPDSGLLLSSFELPAQFGYWYSALGGDGMPAEKHNVTVLANQTVTADFGNTQTNSGKIEGVEFYDADGDGIKIPDEQGLSGRTIFLDNNKNGKYDIGEPCTVTDSAGSYRFENLTPGRYQVGATKKCRWTPTSPLLVSKELIDVNSPRDLVFDQWRNLLYISTGTGTVARYDLTAGNLLSPYTVGNSLRGMDITPDGSALYVTEANFSSGHGTLHKVNLNDGTVTNIAYPLNSGEAGGWDIQIGPHGKGLLSSTYNGSGPVPLRELVPSTDTIAIRTDPPGGTSIDMSTRIFRTADRKRFMLAGTTSAGKIFTYDTATDTFSPSIGRSAYLGNIPFALNPDGSYIAYKLEDPVAGTNSLWIYKDDFSRVMAFEIGDGGVVFDQTRDLLYAAWEEYGDDIIAIDTKTWKEKHRAAIGEDISAFATFTRGEMAVSPDGRHLAMTTGTGVRLFRNYFNIQAVPGRTIENINFGSSMDLLGDLDSDRVVDFKDVKVLSDNWLKPGLSWDISPCDGVVNFLDWSAFADGWQDTTDIAVLAAFAQEWLRYDITCADMGGGPGGDGKINLLDFASLASNWLLDASGVVYDESFETGNFSQFPWSTSGTGLWTVAADPLAFDGAFSAKSASLSSSSILEVTLTTQAGQMSFLYRISAQYANIYFLIDGTMVYSQNGNGLKDWAQITNPVSAGIHTFRWEYSSTSTGNAFLDAVRFPPIVNP
jgi:hypothetical protein